MDRLHQMSVFVAVAETEGFASAARRLSMSPPAVTRAIAALEEHLGIKLLERTTRHVRTTEVGRRYLEDARRILTDVKAADDAAVGVNAEPRGMLSVTAPMMFGRKYVTPLILEYLNQYPETRVDAMFYDRVVNLVEEGLDVGIRIGDLPDSSMRALKVGTIQSTLVASPNYLEQYGTPTTPEDLEAHTLISSRSSNLTQEWRFMTPAGAKTLKVKPRLMVSTNDAAIQAARCDFGITRLLSYQVAECFEDGILKPVLQEYAPEPQPIHIVHREGRYTSARIRAFIDLAAESLRNNPHLRVSRY